MHSPARAASQYVETQVRSSTPLELVVLLYDAALRAGRQAEEAFARRDVPTRALALSRLLAIVGELQNSLDMERGGAISQELDRLYDWMTNRLVDATARQDPGALADVLKLLGTLREAWAAVARPPAGATA